MNQFLRCPTCGSTKGPGCDCRFTDWDKSMVKDSGGRAPLFNEKYYTGFTCPKCGYKASYGHKCVICDK